jgi:hypothetical protein
MWQYNERYSQQEVEARKIIHRRDAATARSNALCESIRYLLQRGVKKGYNRPHFLFRFLWAFPFPFFILADLLVLLLRWDRLALFFVADFFQLLFCLSFTFFVLFLGSTLTVALMSPLAAVWRRV